MDKVQALIDYANQRGIKVVSHDEFEKRPGPKMTLGQYDRLMTRWRCQGRAPRPATNTRHRGSRRAGSTRRTVSSRGDPDEPGDEPPLNSRLLVGGRP